MNKKILFSFLLFFLACPFLAYGAIDSFTDLGNAIIKVSWVIFTAFVVISFLIAGIIFLTAQGNPVKVVKARLAFLWGVIGIIVGIIAYSITTIMSNILK